MSNLSIQDMDQLDVALASCLRILKQPIYWEKITRFANTTIDRPSATILAILAKGPYQFQELVSRLGVEAPSVSRKVHQLEDQGLILRKPTADKRVHELYLSAQGRSLADRLCAARHRLLGEITSTWTARQQKELIESLEHFSNDLKLLFDLNHKK